MISLTTILILVFMHFVADFMLQNDYMAHNKSSNSWILSLHVGIYAVPFLIFGWQFALFNFVAHWITDFITSRITKKLWAMEESHWFFVVIGFDQALHMTALFGSYVWLVG